MGVTGVPVHNEGSMTDEKNQKKVLVGFLKEVKMQGVEISVDLGLKHAYEQS